MSGAEDFLITDGVLREYRGPGGSVTVPAGVTRIGRGAFRDCGGLAAVTLPAGVRSVGEQAFLGCEGLERVSLPEGLDSIEPLAFAGCRSLGSVVLPESLRWVGEAAFRDCRGLRSAVCAGGAVRFGAQAFLGCPSLADGEGFIVMGSVLCSYAGPGGAVTVPAGVTRIGEKAFERCGSLTAVALPEGLREIEAYAFTHTGLRQLLPPEGLVSIGDGAFNACEALESVSLPEGLREIGFSVFCGCRSLRVLRLPRGLERIGPHAFQDCPRLEEVSLPQGLREIDFEAFRNSGLRRLRLPAGLRRIESSAFFECRRLASVSLPKSLRTVEHDAFRSCRSLRTVDCPGRAVRFERGAFSDCPGLTDEGGFVVVGGVLCSYEGEDRAVSVPAGVTRIGDGVFGGSALSSVVLPEGVESIGREAFFNCLRLESVSLPESLRTIGSKAFWHCSGLTRLRLPEKLRSIGAEAFRSCLRLKAAALPEGLVRLRAQTFTGCASLESLSLPESLREIGAGAFSACRRLTSVTLPKGLVAIGDGAFLRCPALRRVTLPRGLRHLGEDVFSDCRAMADETGFCILRGVLYGYFGPERDVTVPEGVTRIAAEAFEEGRKPLRIRLPDSLERISPRAFPRGVPLLLRVRRRVPGLSRALERRRVTALSMAEPSGMPPTLQRALRLGFALAPEEELDTKEARAAMAWMTRNASSLREEAIRTPELLRFLCRYRLIPAGCADEYLEEARKRKSPELAALLLDSLRTPDPGRAAKAEKRRRAREEAAAAARAKRLAERTPEDGVAGLRIAADGCPEDWDSREALWFWLHKRGARLCRGVPRTADYLVTDDPAADTEARRQAEALGMPVLTGRELRAMARERRGPRRSAGIAGLNVAPDRARFLDLWFWDCRSPDELKNLLAAYGATLQRDIGLNTDCLLSDGPEGDSARCLRAEALEIPVIGSRELMDLAHGLSGDGEEDE